MTRYVLLLRGVNVGTKNSLPMSELRTMLTTVGCVDVQTYVQSGNAVFRTTLGTAALTRGIETALERRMGRPIATTLRTAAQMRAVVDRNPLVGLTTSLTQLCVTFLSKTPSPSQLTTLHGRDWEPERLHVTGTEIYTWYPNGQARSPLAAAIAKLPLPGTVTTRNWNSVLRLLEMLEP
jgi:uncharacterized protein (DUF1697 family)